MRVVLDIEANGLRSPTQIWCIVCKDIDTGIVSIFRKPTLDPLVRLSFEDYLTNVSTLIGHNLINYDLRVIKDLLNISISIDKIKDTLVISKLLDYSREDGHSLEAYGNEFGCPKGVNQDFTKYSEELVSYCQQDVEINEKVYRKYKRYIEEDSWQQSIALEQTFQLIVNKLEKHGFSFNTAEASRLLSWVEEQLRVLDDSILTAFPPRSRLVRVVTPRATKFGTIAKNSIPKVMQHQICDCSVDAPFSLFTWEEFNPSSHKQMIEVLNEAEWVPVDKTTTHIQTERELFRLKRQRNKDKAVDLKILELYNKLQELGRTGWKINENNLATLPDTAPLPAHLLAQRIQMEARRRTLTEWLGLVDPDTSRIHGKFYGIGAWTHRMAHQNPNTANIPNEFDIQGKVKLLGKELRSLWQAPPNRLLVGVDAEGVQLRIFAHYIDDPEFTRALVEGKKDDKSDPHSLNQRILGSVCRSRAAAKRFIFALLLGAGIGKLAQILECSQSEAQEALDRLITRYTGFGELKESVIPKDAKRGWFLGLDGRKVRIPGETEGARKHLCMSGYLQTGEAVVMKKASIIWDAQLAADREMDKYYTMLVNMVHDEWQTETADDLEVALKIARLQADALKQAGEELNLKCPLAGSYWNDDAKAYTIGSNWKVTH